LVVPEVEGEVVEVVFWALFFLLRCLFLAVVVPVEDFCVDAAEEGCADDVADLDLVCEPV
jgi:hypothetical protein